MHHVSLVQGGGHVTVPSVFCVFKFAYLFTPDYFKKVNV